MKVLVLGVNGMLGPHALRVLSRTYDLRLTDIAEPHGVFHHKTGFVEDKAQRQYEFLKVDVSDQDQVMNCLLYTSPSPRDRSVSRMPSSA